MDILKDSSAYAVFKKFKRISEIPRCSHDEEKISKFIYDFGRQLNLDTQRDEFGNVIIRKPASEGYEDRDAITLQAHLDMVCEKTDDSTHDFCHDPISLIVDGDIIKADRTTLGADDGIGVALIMALLEDNSLKGPQIEALFTTTEETGMDGALGLSDSVLIGKRLINLDNEEDKMIFVGCAGGVGATITSEIETIIDEDLINFEIRVFGLQGGHSGSMINEPRSNANKLLDSVLLKLKSNLEFKLAQFTGGTKHNAIPSQAKAIIGVKREDIEQLKKSFDEYTHEIKDSLIKRELDLDFSLSETEHENIYIKEDLSNRILRLIQLFPHGVNTMDKELDIVRSSNNLAIVNANKDKFELITSLRSTDEDDLEYLKDLVNNLASSNNFTIEFSDGYPMWKPSFDNRLLNKAKEVYKNLRNEDADVTVIHAGLETGIISEKYPNMDMISIGPNITGAHTPNEKLSISSTEFVFTFVKELINNL